MAFREVILSRVQSFLSPRIDLNFRHLSSFDTTAKLNLISTGGGGGGGVSTLSFVLLPLTFLFFSQFPPNLIPFPKN